MCPGQRAGGQQDPHVGTLAWSSAPGRAAAAVERGATTLSCPPSSCARLRLAPGASSKFSLWSSRSLDCRGHTSLLPARGASKLSSRGQAGRSMSISFPSSSLEDLHWLCLCPLCPKEGAL